MKIRGLVIFVLINTMLAVEVLPQGMAQKNIPSNALSDSISTLAQRLNIDHGTFRNAVSVAVDVSIPQEVDSDQRVPKAHFTHNPSKGMWTRIWDTIKRYALPAGEVASILLFLISCVPEIESERVINRSLFRETLFNVILLSISFLAIPVTAAFVRPYRGRRIVFLASMGVVLILLWVTGGIASLYGEIMRLWTVGDYWNFVAIFSSFFGFPIMTLTAVLYGWVEEREISVPLAQGDINQLKVLLDIDMAKGSLTLGTIYAALKRIGWSSSGSTLSLLQMEALKAIGKAKPDDAKNIGNALGQLLRHNFDGKNKKIIDDPVTRQMLTDLLHYLEEIAPPEKPAGFSAVPPDVVGRRIEPKRVTEQVWALDASI